MNIKKAVQYQTHRMKKSIAVYYGIIYITTILLAVIMEVYTSGGDNWGISGLEILSLIFVFAIIITSFRDTFKMFLQNGLSRRTFFKSFILSIIPLSLFMALMDSLNAMIISTYVKYESIYFQAYQRGYQKGTSEAVKLIEGFLWQFFTCLVVAIIAYFITVLYYRMDKKLTVIVSVSVPTFFIMVLPMIDFKLTNGALSNAILELYYFSFGFSNRANPYYYMVTCIVLFIIIGGLSYGLVRKADVKE